MSSAVPFDTTQTPFQPGLVPYHLQGASHPSQHQQYIPQPVYQQYPGQAGPFSQSDLHPQYSPQDRGQSNQACVDKSLSLASLTSRRCCQQSEMLIE